MARPACPHVPVETILHLREFVSANERHPESVRVFPWLRPAGGDSVLSGIRGDPRGSSGESPKAELSIGLLSFNPPLENHQISSYQ